MNLKALVGSGEKIGLATAPFLVIGLILNMAAPSLFRAGGPSIGVKAISTVALIAGIIVWIWSVVLILTSVPRGRLITSGPYAVVKHPLYTGVSLLVIPSVGLLFNSWLGVLIGIGMYIGSRIFAPEEEEALSKTFGLRWDEYRKKIMVPWL